MQLLKGYQDIDFAKQSLPYNKMSETIIPVGIETPGGKMVLNFVEDSLPEYIDIYLEDREENTFRKITDGFEIDFDEAYEGLGRFYLHFTDQLIPSFRLMIILEFIKVLDLMSWSWALLVKITQRKFMTIQ